MNLVDYVRAFRGLRAAVIGDLMLDSYLEGSTHRVAREAPVPVVHHSHEEHALGGAGNCAANLSALGASVRLLGAVGRDDAGGVIRAKLRDRGIEEEWLIDDPEHVSMRKLRIVANGQYLARFDTGGAWTPPDSQRRRLLERLPALYAWADVLVLSDYDYGVVDAELIALLNELQSRSERCIVVDGKELRRYRGVELSAVTPSHEEAACAVSPQRPGAPVTTDQAQSIGAELLSLLGRTQMAAVTVGKHGVWLCLPHSEPVLVPARPAAQVNDIGAGDSFTATLALGLAAGAQPEDAVRIAVEAAGIAVTRKRTAVVDHVDLLRSVSLLELWSDSELGPLVRRRDEAREQDQTVVLTCGVFDILHAGHVELLRRARALGDTLIVGINSDAGTRRLKGPDRPVNGERSRAALIAALDVVDQVLIFDEDTPEALIRVLRPDLYVKGGDYALRDLPEAGAVEDCGGKTVILPFKDGFSTSLLIERLAGMGTLSGAAVSR